MKLKALLCAAALALAAPLSLGVPHSAQAATFSGNINNGGSYNLSGGPFFWGANFTTGDTANSASFTFTNDVSATNTTTGVTQGTVLQFVGSFLGGATISWAGGQSVTIAQGVTGLFAISTVIASGASDILTVSWGDLSGTAGDIDLQIAAVPLPAAGLLLGAGLGGLGLLGMRRRRRQTA